MGRRYTFPLPNFPKKETNEMQTLYSLNMTPEEYVLACLKKTGGAGFTACDIIHTDRPRMSKKFYNDALGKLTDFVMGDWKPGIKFVRS